MKECTVKNKAEFIEKSFLCVWQLNIFLAKTLLTALVQNVRCRDQISVI